MSVCLYVSFTCFILTIISQSLCLSVFLSLFFSVSIFFFHYAILSLCLYLKDNVNDLIFFSCFVSFSSLPLSLSPSLPPNKTLKVSLYLSLRLSPNSANLCGIKNLPARPDWSVPAQPDHLRQRSDRSSPGIPLHSRECPALDPPEKSWHREMMRYR